MTEFNLAVNLTVENTLVGTAANRIWH
ncbi:hypothetical protein [Photorhabdus temperata]